MLFRIDLAFSSFWVSELDLNLKLGKRSYFFIVVTDSLTFSLPAFVFVFLYKSRTLSLAIYLSQYLWLQDLSATTVNCCRSRNPASHSGLAAHFEIMSTLTLLVNDAFPLCHSGTGTGGIFPITIWEPTSVTEYLAYRRKLFLNLSGILVPSSMLQ